MSNRKHNNYEVIYDPCGAYVLVELTQNQFTKCDITDWFNNLINFKWYVNFDKTINNFYVKTNINHKTVMMHRLILGINNTKIQVDHNNRDTTDNSRKNIRIDFENRNSQNRGKTKNNKSGFKGVHWHKRDKKWQSKIKFKTKTIHIGNFDNVTDAANAYDKMALLYHKEYAVLNFP